MDTDHIPWLILLPPSETKRSTPDERNSFPESSSEAVSQKQPVLELSALAFAEELTEIRTKLIDEVTEESAQKDAAAVFKLGPKQAVALEHNVLLKSSPVIPALMRYTGVLFDEILTEEFTQQQWQWSNDHIVINSALFGPIRAHDHIPNYRFSAQTRIGTQTNMQRWKSALQELFHQFDGPILDFRSKAYAKLGPLEENSERLFLDPAVRDSTGKLKSLSHFNKQTKGKIVQMLMEDQPEFRTISDCVDWLKSKNFSIEFHHTSRASLIMH